MTDGRHQAKVLTVSDGVVAGTREDRSGAALVEALTGAGFVVVERSVVADGVASVAGELVRLCNAFAGLVVTTGGTGFAPRDHTPEGTREILERDAPGLAEAMRLVNPLGRLSRGVAGIRGKAVILNAPGSPRGATECLNAVIDIVPHALALLADEPHAAPVSATEDASWMRRALEVSHTVRTTTSPNPWVGCVVVPGQGVPITGATQPPGGLHAEAVALAAAGPAAAGATVYVTLEPCSHHGRTPPCADALVAAGVRRVVVGLEDPDPRVAGRGLARLRAAGVEVEVGVEADAAAQVLAPYLKHRRTGRPWVVLKLATTLDGRTAAPDGSSKWLTGPEARADAHRLRAQSDAVLVGAATVRTDDPELTVRHVEGADPLRVVLGTAPKGARVLPALELSGPLPGILDQLGRRGVLQVLVEGGAQVAHEFHQQGLVDRYVLYLAPALFGGDDARGAFAGPGAATVGDLWRGRIVDVRQVGPDLRVELAGP